MGQKRIVIIGMGTASAGASAAVNHTNPGAEVSIIEKRGYEMYSACAMPFAFEGKVDFQSLKHEFPARGQRTKVYLGTKAVHIDTNKKEVGIGNREGPSTLPYDLSLIHI